MITVNWQMAIDRFFEKHLQLSPHPCHCFKAIVDEAGKALDFLFTCSNFDSGQLPLFAPADIIDKRYSELVHQSGNGQVEWIDESGEVAVNGGQKHFEWYSVYARKWYKVTVYSPEHLYVVAVLQDLTDYMDRNKALEKEKNFFESLVNSQEEMVCRLQPDTTLTFVNQAYCKTVGMLSGELLGQKLLALVPESEHQYLAHKLQSLEVTRAPFVFDHKMMLEGDRERWIEWSFTPVWNSRKKLAAIQGVARDVTSQKLAEAELIRAKEKALESDRFKSASIANMSHEIRTPMSGILGFAELLKDPSIEPEQQQKFINIIEQSGHHMLNLINSIIDISKIESGQMDVNFSKLDINEEMVAMYEFFVPQFQLEKEDVKLELQIPDETRVIISDRHKLKSILTNLLNNALKYTSEGKVEMGYRKKGRWLEFYVKDTGIGIKEEFAAQVFDRFFQADTVPSRGDNEGSGLGLSISKAFVEMLGGKIWEKSKSGKGSTFYFTLPDKQPVSETREQQTSEKPAKTRSQRPKESVILLVEDDKYSAELFSVYAQDWPYKMIHAATGQEALEKFKNMPQIDLILMDIKLPGISGLEVTREIREMGSSIPIIAQSAHAIEGDKEKAFRAGCNDYISKPVSKSALLACIDRNLRAHKN